jgi:hypothetical protein
MGEIMTRIEQYARNQDIADKARADRESRQRFLTNWGMIGNALWWAAFMTCIAAIVYFGIPVTRHFISGWRF